MDMLVGFVGFPKLRLGNGLRASRVNRTHTGPGALANSS